MTTAFDKEIEEQLDTRAPGSALVIDPDPNHALSAYAARHPDCQVIRLDEGGALARVASLGRFDAAVVANTLEHMDRTGAGRLIARLRDLNTPRLFVVVPVGIGRPGSAGTWAPADMIAYGLSLVRECERDGKPVRLYKFDIFDYKKDPDWLNPEHWANPELWDKYRW